MENSERKKATIYSTLAYTYTNRYVIKVELKLSWTKPTIKIHTDLRPLNGMYHIYFAARNSQHNGYF